MIFKQLHYAQEPLLLCNVWDGASAKLAKKMKFKAIGTSSAAIAHAMGMEDGEHMVFADLYRCVQQIKAHTNLPLSVDIEAGYSDDPLEVARYIKLLAQLGVQGVNIEDSKVIEERILVDKQSFAGFLKIIINKLREEPVDVFVNARTDVFLLSAAEPVDEACSRIRIYQEAGVDGVFVPGVVNDSDISTLVKHSTLPLNVMCMPELTNFGTLAKLGVKRISMGNFLFENMHRHLETTLVEVIKAQSFKPVF